MQTNKVWDIHVETNRELFSTPEIPLGRWTSWSMIHDPKHMCFVLSRYKFCSKMLEGKNNVLEIGCGDGIGIPIIAQNVKNLYCVDWDNKNIESNYKRYYFLSNVSYQCVDFINSGILGRFDSAFSIDVIEHIDKKDDDRFMSNICRVLDINGVCIIGTPNKDASHLSNARIVKQHINLKTAQELKELVLKYFYNCFMFSMNDEVVHTGYAPMAHYLFAIGVGKR